MDIVQNIQKQNDEKVGQQFGQHKDDWQSFGNIMDSMGKTFQSLGDWNMADIFCLWKLAQRHGKQIDEMENIDLIGDEVTDKEILFQLLEDCEIAYGAYVGDDKVKMGDLTNLKYHDILYVKGQASVNHPAYFIARDTTAKQLLLVIRGTMQMEDIATDLTGLCDDTYGVTSHQGIKRSALIMLDQCIPRIRELFEREEFKDYGFKIIGHSLGGGAGVLMTYMLRNIDDFKDLLEVQDIQCVSFAGPPSLTPEVAESCKSYITSVQAPFDMVPRISLTNVQRLHREVRMMAGEEEYDKIQAANQKLVHNEFKRKLCDVKVYVGPLTESAVKQKQQNPIQKFMGNFGKSNSQKDTSKPYSEEERRHLEQKIDSGFNGDPKIEYNEKITDKGERISVASVSPSDRDQMKEQVFSEDYVHIMINIKYDQQTKFDSNMAKRDLRSKEQIQDDIVNQFQKSEDRKEKRNMAAEQIKSKNKEYKENHNNQSLPQDQSSSNGQHNRDISIVKKDKNPFQKIGSIFKHKGKQVSAKKREVQQDLDSANQRNLGPRGGFTQDDRDVDVQNQQDQNSSHNPSTSKKENVTSSESQTLNNETHIDSQTQKDPMQARDDNISGNQKLSQERLASFNQQQYERQQSQKLQPNQDQQDSKENGKGGNQEGVGDNQEEYTAHQDYTKIRSNPNAAKDDHYQTALKNAQAQDKIHSMLVQNQTKNKDKDNHQNQGQGQGQGQDQGQGQSEDYSRRNYQLQGSQDDNVSEKASEYDEERAKNIQNPNVELCQPGTVYHIQRFKDEFGFCREKLIRNNSPLQTPLRIILQKAAFDDHFLQPYMKGLKNCIKYMDTDDGFTQKKRLAINNIFGAVEGA